MCGYITSARGHELSGRVRAYAYNYYAWAECTWVAICDHALCIYRGVDLPLWSYRWCQKVLCGVKSEFFGAR